MVGITGQFHRYLKECVKLDSILTGRLGTMQDCNKLAILFYFWKLVDLMETRDLDHLVDAKLVQDATRELEALPLKQPKAGKEKKTRKEPQVGNLNIA